MVRRLIGAMLFGVAVYGAFVLYSGVGLIASRFGDFAWWTFAAACALAFSNYLIRFLKWEYYLGVLEIRGVPKGESLLIFLSGFVLTVTPGKVGEVFKSLILKEIRGVPVERTAPIVVAERVTDLIGVITLIAVGSLSLPGGVVWASAGAGAVVALLAFVSSPALSTWLLTLLSRLPGRLGKAFTRIAWKIEVALLQLRELTTPRRLIWPTLLSIAAWSLEGIALWVILKGFDEHPPLTTTAFIYATATLAGALVPVPGGLGVTDGLLKGQMAGLAGIGAATATAAMLLVRFATLWFAVAVGFIALALLRARNPSLAANGDASEAPAGAGIEKTP
ncbi:MAG: lysylphosphatidylglycerol synthase transmembrane domain-containing protein [Byssovorax sp.]